MTRSSSGATGDAYGVLAGRARDVYVAGRYAYVAADGSGLLVFDVSNPENVSVVNAYSTGGLAYGVQVEGDLAYVVNLNGQLIVLNVSNPHDLVEVGRIALEANGGAVRVVNRHAYVAGWRGGLRILDVSEPTAPVLLATFDTPGLVRDVSTQEERIYLADDSSGIFEVRSVANFQLNFQATAISDLPFTIESTTNLQSGAVWLPLFRTNSPVMPVKFTDYDVRGPRKFYRVRQP